MPDRKLQLRPFLDLLGVEDGSLQFRGSNREVWRVSSNELSRTVLKLLVSYFEEAHSEEEAISFVRASVPTVSETAVKGVIQHLIELEIIDVVDHGVRTAEMASLGDQFLALSRIGVEQALAIEQRLHASTVYVIGDGELVVQLTSQLQLAGVGTLKWFTPEASAIETGASRPTPPLPSGYLEHGGVLPRTEPWAEFPKPSLVMATVDRFDPVFVNRLNDEFLIQEIPWMLLQTPNTEEGVVGPIFVPGQTACYACLEARINANADFYPEWEGFIRLLASTGRRSKRVGALRPALGIMAGYAALEALKFLSSALPPRLVGRFMTIRYNDLTTEVHDIFRVPRCPKCKPLQPPVSFWKLQPHVDRHE